MRYKKIFSILLIVVACLLTITIFADNNSKKHYKNTEKINPYKTMKLVTITEQENIEDKIIITDNNGVKKPFLLSKKNDKVFFILPLYRENQVSIKINLKPDQYILMNTDEIFNMDTDENLKVFKSYLNSYHQRDLNYSLKKNQDFDMVANEESAPTSAPSTQDFSKTNVQVQGIDEGDYVKTDGEYIYYLNNGKINIVKAENNGKMKDIANIVLESDFYAEQIFLHNDKLMVLGNEFGIKKSFATMYMYDLKDPKHPKRIRKTSQEGNFVNARKVDNILHFVTQLSMFSVNDRPVVRDTVQKEIRHMELNKFMIFPCPDYSSSDIVTITSLPIDDKTYANRINFVGSADDIYMNDDTLIISQEEWRMYYDFRNTKLDEPVVSIETGENGLEEISEVTPSNENVVDDGGVKTILRRFDIKGTNIIYRNEASISGRLINQFAMDVNNTNLRVAYTSGNNKFGSSVSIFNKHMQEVGKLNNIAKGEKIYSARFMGDKLYLVTFKEVDPFFVIDLKDVSKPEILGFLKIPGYSSYLHPIDDTHIMGFGYDVNANGRAIYNEGVKIAIFDVTDMKNPKQISNVVIGDQGTYTPLAHDHRALTYNGNKKYFAFPINITRKNKVNDLGYVTSEEVFQGAYIYDITDKYELKLKGGITHKNASIRHNYEYSKNIKRIVYIGDVLYTISDHGIQSNYYSNLKYLDAINWN